MRIPIPILSLSVSILGSGLLSSAESSQFHHGVLAHRQRRDASTFMAEITGSEANNTDGENHSKPKPPKGADLVSFPVGDQNNKVAVYWTSRPNNQRAKQVYVMIHGRLRDADTYWSTMNDILESALKDNYPGVDQNAIIVAPQFYSAKLNSGQYAKDELAWDDVNAWQAGERAIQPKNSNESSFDVLDAFIDQFTDKKTYPAIKSLIFVGHGGGGQLMTRYAIVAKDAPLGYNMRWIVGDPSSQPYFTPDRPTIKTEKLPTKDKCPLYDTWRYGFTNFTATLQRPGPGPGPGPGPMTPKEYFNQTIKRDVRYIIGNDDTADNGDQYCMALMQGGTARRNRNLIWWQYINTLARTTEDLTGFPATFPPLADWSDVSLNQIQHRLTVVENASHSAQQVFSSDLGRAVLFKDDNSNLPTGWRPPGWNPKGNPPKVAALNHSPNSTSSSSSSSSSAPPNPQQTNLIHSSSQASLLSPTPITLLLLFITTPLSVYTFI